MTREQIIKRTWKSFNGAWNFHTHPSLRLPEWELACGPLPEPPIGDIPKMEYRILDFEHRVLVSNLDPRDRVEQIVCEGVVVSEYHFPA